MPRFTYQFAKTDTLASQMAAGATSATLSAGNFDNFTADYLVLDYNNPSKREVIKCNVSGTAVSSATRGVEGSDVTHSAGAAVAYAFLPDHAEFISESAETGWIESQDTWVYASASTFTIAGIDRTTTYTKGTKLRFKQGAGYKYATVASSAFATNTTVTILVNTDYTIANSAITDNDYSYVESPQGYPHYFNCTPTYSNITVGDGTVVARYAPKGKTIHFQYSLVVGSTTAIGNSATIIVPVAFSTSYDTTQPIAIGTVTANDAGTALYGGQCYIGGAATIALRFQGAPLTTTFPFTEVAGDALMVSATYEY